MFSKSSSDIKGAEKATTIINNLTSITGDIKCDGNLRLDGRVTGNVFVKMRFVIGEAGRVDGNVNANNCEISGLVNGDINIEDIINLTSTSKIEGNIKTKKLVIEAGSVFNGKCIMAKVEDLTNKPK